MCDDGCDVAVVMVSEAEDDDTFSLALGDNLHLPFPLDCRLCLLLRFEFGRCDDIDCFDDSTGKCRRVFPFWCDGVQGKESEE